MKIQQVRYKTDFEEFNNPPLAGYDDAPRPDAGFDIQSPETILLDPGMIYTIDTGLHLYLPESSDDFYWAVQLSNRSSYAKKGVLITNAAGLGDSGYTGSYKITVINHSKNPFLIEKGDRFCQFRLIKCYYTRFLKGYPIESERGESGSGSTGK